MKQRIVQCDQAAIPAHWPDEFGKDPPIQINKFGRPTKQVSLRLHELSDPLAGTLQGRAFDLVNIAAYVYVADQLISRGGITDVYGDDWRRNLAISLPVSEPNFWGRADIKNLLEQTVSFVSEDNWHFAFSLSHAPEQIPLSNIDQKSIRYNPDSVILFSGGADSLCATAEAVLDSGLKPVLVSHRSVPIMSSQQKLLVEQLRQAITGWQFPHSKFVVNKVQIGEKDTTQRTRSFLFASLGSAIASSVGTNNVILADNGMVSLNLPINKQLVGSLASRSTHPRFIHYFKALSKATLPYEPQVSNPLRMKTKSEALSILQKHNLAKLLLYTNSCAHRRNRSSDTPHCGVCSQCVDRRFSILAAGLEQFDPIENYENDIFRDGLDGNDVTMAESYVCFAEKAQSFTPEGLYMELPQLGDAIEDDDKYADTTALQYASLVQRHANSVINVMSKQVGIASQDLVLKHLPSTCLISLSVQTSESKMMPITDNSTQPTQYFVFKRKGDYWDLRFESNKSIVKHYEGLDYIAYLLAKPNQDIGIFELVSLGNKKSDNMSISNYKSISSEELENEGLSISGFGDAGEILDDNSKKQYRERLLEINEELSSAMVRENDEQAEKLEAEKDALIT
jgi:7-cyano-7-deazaguanine synthase in queuosine biosynthesis